MGASTLVVAREDLSIPGAAAETAVSTADIEAKFFNVVRQHSPDVVVLDLTESQGHGVAAILKIRRRTGVPILVVCGADDPMMREYCLAGAVECMQAPVDIMLLNQTVQQIIRLSRNSRLDVAGEPAQTQPIVFADLTLHSRANLLIAADGSSAKLVIDDSTLTNNSTPIPYWQWCTGVSTDNPHASGSATCSPSPIDTTFCDANGANCTTVCSS